MRGKSVVIIIAVLLILVACMPTVESVSNMGKTAVSPTPTPLPSYTQKPATAIIPASSPPPINLPSSAYPPPPVTVTSPYPGLPPQGARPTRPRATSTPPITTFPVDDCTIHPSFSRCGGTQLTGKLAYLQTDGDLTVLDFDTETAWMSTQTNLRTVDWSPSGNSLLVHNKAHYAFFYHPDGTLYDFDDSPHAWASTGSRQRNSYLWTEDYLLSASLIRPGTELMDDGVLNTERMARFEFQDGTGRIYWSVEDSEFYQEIIKFIDWVPQTEWILLGYGNGGTATRMAMGYRLKALNARTGEIIDSGLYIPADVHFNWHPSETGLLVTTDLHGSDMSGAGALVLWQIVDNEITYPSELAYSTFTPVWSPDGRYIAYGNLESYEYGQQLMVLDTETGIAEIRAEMGARPAWSRDGSIIFYMEMTSNDDVLLRAVGREQGKPLTIAVTQSTSYPEARLSQTAFDYTP